MNASLTSKPKPTHPFALKFLKCFSQQDLNELTAIAQQIAQSPIAFISIIDDKTQWVQSQQGLEILQWPRKGSFCNDTMAQCDVFIVEDASEDKRFSDFFLVRRKDIQARFYAGVPLLSAGGLPIGTLCVIDTKSRVFTEQQKNSLKGLAHQIEHQLRLNFQLENFEILNQKLIFQSTALENISDGVVIHNSDGVVIDFNAAALSVLGLTADQMTGKTSFDPDWKAIQEDGAPFPGELHPAMIALKTGQTVRKVIMGVRHGVSDQRWLQINAVPLFKDHVKTPFQVVVSFADITEQKISQQKAQQKEDNLKNMLDGMPSLIGHWSDELINLNANKAYYDYFKKRPEDIKGKHMIDVLGEEIFLKNKIYIENVLNGIQQTFERELPYKDGTIRQVIANYLPEFKNGQVKGFFVIVTDITDVKKLESQRRDIEARMIESSRLTTLGEMAAGIAHEVNNPLSIIQGKAAQLRRKFESGHFDFIKDLEDFKKIESTVSRISKIIKGLRAFSRNAENDSFELIRVSQLLEETLHLCEERFKFSEIELRLKPFQDLTIECRSVQISQVLMNLLNNSFDAIQHLSDKWVEVSVTSDENSVSISIMDSGNGIEETVLKKLMQPFFTTKEVGKGTGLGLSISKGIIEAHQGQLTYDKDCPHTCFTVKIPQKQNQVQVIKKTNAA